jgi:hypothetical protein
MTLILTGLDIPRKAQILEETIVAGLGGRDQYAVFDSQLVRADQANPASNDEAFAYLRLGVIDPDPVKVARFSSAIVEMALASIPGFTATAPPSKGTPAIQHWPALVANRHIRPRVVIGDESVTVEPLEGRDAKFPRGTLSTDAGGPAMTADMLSLPFGRLFGTRSGDKGGNANLGVWARSVEAYEFLRSFLSIARLKTLLPDVTPYDVERYELPNLKALNFYIKGFLGEGVAASLKSDPQAKTLGEYLRAKSIDIPAELQHQAAAGPQP